MSSQIFKLDFKNGTLVIPSEAMEYLNQCQGEIEVTLTIQSIDAKTALPYSENGERDYQRAWNRWLAEVDQLESSPSTSEPDEYGKALIEKHSKLGL